MMKTTLPESISTIEEANAFLTELNNNREVFHPEDDAHDIIWDMPKEHAPTHDECDKLNSLMEQMYEIEGYDPCEIICTLNGI